MQSLKHKIMNTLIHLPLDGDVNPYFGLVLGISGLIQLTAVITHPSSLIKKATSWADPNTYLGPIFTVIAGTILTLLYIIPLGIRFAMT